MLRLIAVSVLQIVGLKLNRKRVRNPKTWKQNKRKLNRNIGQEYVSKNNVVVPARSSINCKCAKRCTDKFLIAAKNKILEDFNNLKEKNVQDAYLFGLITKAPVARYVYIFSYYP